MRSATFANRASVRSVDQAGHGGEFARSSVVDGGRVVEWRRFAVLDRPGSFAHRQYETRSARSPGIGT